MNEYWCSLERSGNNAEQVTDMSIDDAAEQFARFVFGVNEFELGDEFDVYVSEDKVIWYHYIGRVLLTADAVPCDDDDCIFCKDGNND